MGFGKDGKGAILREGGGITLGTLADRTAIKSSSQLAIEDDFRIVKTEVMVALRSPTPADAPIYFGIADNELSVTEIKECLDVDGPLDRNDRLNDERATRAVWILCQLGDEETGDGHEIPNEGMPIEKTLRWTFNNPEGWTFFAFNNSGGSLTTGAVISFQAVHYGVWVV